MASGVEDNGTAEDSIHTELKFLVKDPKHEHEKPYHLRYDTGGAIPKTNMENESRPVEIHNFRPFQDSPSFDEYGFSLMNTGLRFTAADFHNEKKVEELFWPAIQKLIWKTFPNAAEIKLLEHGLRKRHANFPDVTEEESSEVTQPATLVHIDFSYESAVRTAQAAFKMSPVQYRRLVTVKLVTQRDFESSCFETEMYSFWKSFQGPGNDWPLALCDSRTIDYVAETIAADVVFYNSFTENERVSYSPNHEWYYFKDLRDDEIIMHRQTDSDIPGGGGVAHSSFFNPKADKDALPRASFELRAFVFFT
ncbi:uncharacterized protein PAC_12646 [Phialocephala subalpina]|uniref:7alpha-cephem-methoxylase P8 chain n=1 Tax=Phialocephala subalpina TaxID=576137 RepID=A0A1L7XCI7_9HELO|nr:uncharacterized protein PAC_12646 [Phialocephala subalpina]